jgi:hypothetical protein
MAWSVSGAIYAASDFDGSPERRRLYQAAIAAAGHEVAGPLSAWNDARGRTKAEVLAVLDRAIAATGSRRDQEPERSFEDRRP